MKFSIHIIREFPLLHYDMGTFWKMATLLNVWSVLANYASNQPIVANSYIAPVEQFTVRVEVVLVQQAVVEEFSVTFDRSLNLSRFEYTLDDRVPPYYTSSPMRTIWDMNTGTFYDMDTVTGSCRIAFLNATNNDLSTHTLLRTIGPDQIFATSPTIRFLRKDITRGMQADAFTTDPKDFFIAGYGTVQSRHIIHTVSGNTRKYFAGGPQNGILLQREIYMGAVDNNSIPVLIINYFDIESPTASSPKIYDFNVLSCLKNVQMEPTEEIMIKFSGTINKNAPSVQNDEATVIGSRRKMWQELSKITGLSPVRSVGNFWSQDDQNSYFTTVLLPRPNPTNFYNKFSSPVSVRFLGYGADPAGSRAMELGFQMLIQTCAERCSKDGNCQRFAWCSGNSNWNTYVCVLQPNLDVTGLESKNVLTGCELYQDKAIDRVDRLDVSDALEKLGAAVKERRISIYVGDKQLIAKELRRNVSLMASTKGESTPEVFTLYKSFSNLAGSAIRATFNKLNSKQCNEKCLGENRFLCQTFVSCGYGDCFLSDLHGDEILYTSPSNMVNHSHCTMWSRVWTNEYVKVSPALFHSMTPERTDLSFVQNVETCAKQCSSISNSGKECESFAWCKGQKVVPNCKIYAQHVFDQASFMEGTTNSSTDLYCTFYTKNYLTSFKELPTRTLVKNSGHDFTDIEVPIRLGEWRCAKACLDILGDDHCLSMEMCSIDENENSRRCRISGMFVPLPGKKISNATFPKSSCSVYSRMKYLDGTPVSERTGSVMKTSKERRSDIVQICMPSGYSSGDMATLAFCMLALGCGLVAISFILAKRFLPAREISFVRLSDK